MIESILRFSIERRYLTLSFILVLIGSGLWSYQHLPIDAVPDITNVQVQINTQAPGYSPLEAEQRITYPVETALAGLPNLSYTRSLSRYGLSQVTVVFEEGTDIYFARNLLNERLSAIANALPPGLEPEMGPIATGLGEIFTYTVEALPGAVQEDGSPYDATALREIQDWIIKPQLALVPGVVEVNTIGGYTKQYHVTPDPQKLLAFDVTLDKLIEALKKNNENRGAGYIERNGQQFLVRSPGQLQSIEEIEQVVVKSHEGVPVQVGDLAEVAIGKELRTGAATRDGVETVLGTAMMLMGENSRTVARDLAARLEQIQPSLPEGIRVEAVYDRTTLVDKAIATVKKNLLEGALLVIAVLFILLGNIRAALITAAVIPLSMLATITGMVRTGVSANLMSLGALDFGLIVDGAVIIVENTIRRLSEAQAHKGGLLERRERLKVVFEATNEVIRPSLFGVLIITVVYIPLFTLTGVEGKMFQPMAATVVMALLAALVLSLTIVPAAVATFMSGRVSEKENRVVGAAKSAYKPMLEGALRLRWWIVSAATVLVAASAWLATTLGSEFVPQLDEGDIALHALRVTGTGLEQSVAMQEALEKRILAFPQVEKVFAKIGTPEVATDPMPPNVADNFVILKPRSEWPDPDLPKSELVEQIEASLSELPGNNYEFTQPIEMRFNELISGARQDVVCKIFGENLDTLAHYAAKLGHVANTVDGSSALYVEAVTGMPQILIQYNRAAIAQYGMNISDVNNVINAAFAGQSSGLVYEGEKRFDLVVRLAGDSRKSLADVQNLLIATPQGMQIPLRTLAAIDIVDGYNQIQRENSQRRIIVGFNVRGRDIQSTVEELQQKVTQQVKLPAGYYITYGGAFENLEAAKKRLYIAVPVSLLLIFLMLFFAFRSVTQGLLIYTAIPLSAIGGIIALSIRGIPFSISAGVGFIALFGVAVLNGIVLVAEFNRLRTEEQMKDLTRVVIQGTKIRLRPVLMTAFVASLGFLPMAISTGEGAEVQRPLATVVIGGLLVATLLTLFVLPILYIMFQKKAGAAKKGITVGIILMGLLNSQSTEAQMPISLQAAIDTALANNLNIKNQRLRSEYHKILISSGKQIAPTNIVAEYGQMNSIYADAKLGLNQTLSFPKVHRSQKELLTEEWESSVLNIGVNEALLKKQVTQVYGQLVYLEAKKKVLERTDTLFSAFLAKANLRFDKGESNLLEKKTAENQRGQIALQLSQLMQDRELAQIRFRLLLNSTTMFTAIEEDIVNVSIRFTDTVSLKKHPGLLYLAQQQETAGAATQVERAKLLPDLVLGYNIMSMKGNGADNKEYNSAPRFQSVQVGLGIPIFNTAQKARIRAARVNEQLTRQEYTASVKTFVSDCQSAFVQYQKSADAKRYFETTALKNAEAITATANQQFTNGDINYLEWAMLINQAVSVQSGYAEVLYNLANAVADLNYFTGN